MGHKFNKIIYRLVGPNTAPLNFFYIQLQVVPTKTGKRKIQHQAHVLTTIHELVSAGSVPSRGLETCLGAKMQMDPVFYLFPMKGLRGGTCLGTRH